MRYRPCRSRWISPSGSEKPPDIFISEMFGSITICTDLAVNMNHRNQMTRSDTKAVNNFHRLKPREGVVLSSVGVNVLGVSPDSGFFSTNCLDPLVACNSYRVHIFRYDNCLSNVSATITTSDYSVSSWPQRNDISSKTPKRPNFIYSHIGGVV